MTDLSNFPPNTRSVVTVVFRETGEIKEYPISAHPGISRYLADQIAATGCLCLLCGETSHTILADRIQEYSIQEVRHAPPPDKPEGEPQ